MIADFRYALRQFVKTPGFTATTLLTLALCLGATLTIFAVVRSVLLQPLPFPKADQLVAIYNSYPKAGVANDGSSITITTSAGATFPRSRASRSTATTVMLSGTRLDRAGRRSSRFARIFTTLGINLAMVARSARRKRTWGTASSFNRRLLARPL
jgi:hypothetical protein